MASYRQGATGEAGSALDPSAMCRCFSTGPRAAPGEAGLGLARELGPRYATLLPAIERALFEHYEPYAEAVESGEAEHLGEVPRLGSSEQVGAHARSCGC